MLRTETNLIFINTILFFVKAELYIRTLYFQIIGEYLMETNGHVFLVFKVIFMDEKTILV